MPTFRPVDSQCMIKVCRSCIRLKISLQSLNFAIKVSHDAHLEYVMILVLLILPDPQTEERVEPIAVGRLDRVLHPPHAPIPPP